MARRDLAAPARRRIAEALGFPAIGPSSEHVARLPPPAWRTTGSRTPKTDRISLPALRRRPPRMPLSPRRRLADASQARRTQAPTAAIASLASESSGANACQTCIIVRPLLEHDVTSRHADASGQAERVVEQRSRRSRPAPTAEGARANLRAAATRAAIGVGPGQVERRHQAELLAIDHRVSAAGRRPGVRSDVEVHPRRQAHRRGRQRAAGVT